MSKILLPVLKCKLVLLKKKQLICWLIVEICSDAIKLYNILILFCFPLSVCFTPALTLMYSTAEREYFLQTSNLTWDEGRNHCQVQYGCQVYVQEEVET